MPANAAPDSPRPAERCCDIVLKGGVTSGIVYPTAIYEVALAYRFRSIGGTSIGAVGAACAAAAEYRRYRARLAGDVGGELRGFKILRDLPEWLCCPDDTAEHVRPIFQPDPPTKRYFETLERALEKRGRRRLLAVPLATPRRFPLAALLGTLPGLLIGLAAAALLWRASSRLGLTLAAAVVLGVIAAALIAVGAVVAATIAFVRGVLRGLRDNAYGLLRGSAGAVHPSPRVPTALEELNPKPLTDWLADLIDLIAGKRGPQPLTFADLWAADKAVVPPAVCELDERARAIRLQMLSTCLNLGRPYRLPFEEPAARFYFRLEEWRRFFPERVVDHLDRHSCSDDGYRLVPGVQLPVVVAARLSLSFPFLFSAVPLYQKDDTGRFLRCWFSDGGITSNFPIHFFDALLPRWPTFGITLRGPRYRAAGGERRKGRFVEPGDPEPDRIETVKDFATSITDAARNWSDNRQSQLPGWRDRIAHVPFDQGQGGLNLKPDAATIRLLAERGAKAGRELVDRFATDPPRLWSENRWIRYRSTMYAITVMLERLQRGWEGIPPGETRCQPDPKSYEEVIGEFGETGPYPWRDGQGERAKEATDALLDMIRACFSDERFDGAPQPEPVLRITPDI